ncbi:MAG: polymer-forming cytoskeletal protein [Desulfobacterales bacterium]|nr:polymer-forming cytoskeletal protein [Desulfobacterales bacterium]
MGKKKEYLSIIDKGLTIDGEASCKGEMVVRGAVKGILDGEKVVIASGGAVYAKANVVDMTIAGSFEGTLRASGSLTVLDNGSCLGKVACKHLVVEAGGNLNAEVTYIDAEDKKP